MNRKQFLITVGISLTALSAFGAKKKKGSQNNSKKKIASSTSNLALTGTISLKPKEHGSEADDYYIHTKSKRYIISRTLYKKIEGSVGQEVTLYCTVLGGKKIIKINYIKK